MGITQRLIAILVEQGKQALAIVRFDKAIPPPHLHAAAEQKRHLAIGRMIVRRLALSDRKYIDRCRRWLTRILRVILEEEVQ